MNTVGKILVVLNFLFVLVLLAFLILDVAIRNQWKDAYNTMKREAEILKASRDADSNVRIKLINEFQANRIELEARKQDLADADSKFAVVKLGLDEQINDLNLRKTTQDLALKDTIAAKIRLTAEIDLLTKTIKDRESLIVKLEADNKIINIQAQTHEANYRTAKGRNENLLEEIRKLNGALARKDGGVNPDRMVIQNPNEPNPPAILVNGKVEKVEGGDLMLISLGTDHGVAKNNTLDIYRLTPEPKYLGMVRIVDANHHKSVARLIPSGNAAFRPQLREGDLVTSKLTK